MTVFGGDRATGFCDPGVTSNTRKDLLPCADGIVVGKPLGIPAGNDEHRGAKSRDVPSRQDGAISDGRTRM